MRSIFILVLILFIPLFCKAEDIRHSKTLNASPEAESRLSVWVREPELSGDLCGLFHLSFPKTVDSKPFHSAEFMLVDPENDFLSPVLVPFAVIPIQTVDSGACLSGKFGVNRKWVKHASCRLAYLKPNSEFPTYVDIKLAEYVKKKTYQSYLNTIRSSALTKKEGYFSTIKEVEKCLDKNDWPGAITRLQKMLDKVEPSDKDCRESIKYLMERCRQCTENTKIKDRERNQPSTSKSTVRKQQIDHQVGPAVMQHG